MFSFEKKNQKTFSTHATQLEMGQIRQSAKVFCFCFSKKKTFFLPV